VDVILSSLSDEPVPGEVRVAALSKHYRHESHRVTFSHHNDDAAPQVPQTLEEWTYWRDLINGKPRRYYYDFVIASEPYGKKVAELIDAEFIPFDPDRRLIDARGQDVRDHPDWEFSKLLPEFGAVMASTVVFFGQESCGKTTMTEAMGHEFDAYTTHEFARPYLESMDDRTVTDSKMGRIAIGQYALQKTARAKGDRMFVFHDTDLLSTIGYYRIYGGKPKPYLEDLFREAKADLYVVMNDEIPFEEDALRYGGKVRESTKQFWIDLLEEFGCKYYVVKETDFNDQMEELFPVIQDVHESKWAPIAKFQRKR
jgi:NadR type nicotinamide-nucleotide adenylyltransferase